MVAVGVGTNGGGERETISGRMAGLRAESDVDKSKEIKMGLCHKMS